MTDDPTDLQARLSQTHGDDAPDAVLAAARAAYSWRTVDVDVRRPAYDSLLDEALTSVRGASDARLLRFEDEGLAVDVELAQDGDARSAVGQVTPPHAGEVAARQGDGSELSARVDDLGRFVLDALRAGPLSLRCDLADGRTLVTDWVLV